MPAVTTILNRINRAKEFIQSSLTQDYWLALGNVNTSWEEEELPIIPNPTLLEVPELLGAVYISTLSLIAEDPTGTIYNDFGRYKAYDVSTNNQTLINNLVTKVYLVAYLDSYNLPVGVKYRSLGLITNVETDISLVKGQGTYLKAKDIKGYTLLWINNIPPKTILPNMLEQLQVIMEF